MKLFNWKKHRTLYLHSDALEAIVDTAFEEVKEDIKNLYEDLKELVSITV